MVQYSDIFVPLPIVSFFSLQFGKYNTAQRQWSSYERRCVFDALNTGNIHQYSQKSRNQEEEDKENVKKFSDQQVQQKVQEMLVKDQISNADLTFISDARRSIDRLCSKSEREGLKEKEKELRTHSVTGALAKFKEAGNYKNFYKFEKERNILLSTDIEIVWEITADNKSLRAEYIKFLHHAPLSRHLVKLAKNISPSFLYNLKPEKYKKWLLDWQDIVLKKNRTEAANAPNSENDEISARQWTEQLKEELKFETEAISQAERDAKMLEGIKKGLGEIAAQKAQNILEQQQGSSGSKYTELFTFLAHERYQRLARAAESSAEKVQEEIAWSQEFFTELIHLLPVSEERKQEFLDMAETQYTQHQKEIVLATSQDDKTLAATITELGILSETGIARFLEFKTKQQEMFQEATELYALGQQFDADLFHIGELWRKDPLYDPENGESVIPFTVETALNDILQKYTLDGSQKPALCTYLLEGKPAVLHLLPEVAAWQSHWQFSQKDVNAAIRHPESFFSINRLNADLVVQQCSELAHKEKRFLTNWFCQETYGLKKTVPSKVFTDIFDRMGHMEAQIKNYLIDTSGQMPDPEEFQTELFEFMEEAEQLAKNLYENIEQQKKLITELQSYVQSENSQKILTEQYSLLQKQDFNLNNFGSFELFKKEFHRLRTQEGATTRELFTYASELLQDFRVDLSPYHTAQEDIANTNQVLSKELNLWRKRGISSVSADIANIPLPIADIFTQQSQERITSILSKSPNLKSAVVKFEKDKSAAEAEWNKCRRIYEIFTELGEKGSLSDHFTELENISFNGGKKLLKKVSDANFKRKYVDTNVSEGGFVIEFHNGVPEILIKESIYEALKNGDAGIENTYLRGLRHEIAHILIENSDHAISNFLQALTPEHESEFRQQLGKIYQQKQISIDGKTRSLEFEEMADEFLVSCLAGGYEADFEHLRSKVEEWLTEKGGITNVLQLNSEEISENLAAHTLKDNFWTRLKGKKVAKGESSKKQITSQEEENLKKKFSSQKERREILLQNFLDEKKLLEEKLNKVLKAKIKDTGKAQYANHIQEMFTAMEEDIHSAEEKNLDNVNNKVNAGLKDIKGSLNTNIFEIGEQASDPIGIIRNVWDNTTFLSLSDVGQMWTTFAEWMTRRHERNKKRRAGEAGEALTSGVNQALASEYDQLQESAEKEEVSKQKEALGNKSAAQLYDEIKTIKSSEKDKFKALMQVLAEKGLINWRNKDIWHALSRLGGGVRFYDTDRYNYGGLSSKMQRAFTNLYDEDEYRELERNNRSKYDSKMSEYEKETEEQQGRLVPEIQKMLIDHRKGVFIDPPRYEIFVRKLIENGKGSPPDALYYLIMGVGKGLLTEDRATTFDANFLNIYPWTQYLDFKKPNLDTFEQWANDFDSPDMTPPERFKEWIHYEVMTTDVVVERAEKASSDGNWDHDFMAHYGDMLSSKAMESITGLKTEGATLYKPTAYPNLIASFTQAFGINTKNANSMSNEKFRLNVSRQIAAYAMLDGILGNRVMTGDKKYRLGPEGFRRSPRDPSIFRKESTRTFMQYNRNIIKVFDAELCELLFDDSQRGKNSEATHGKVVADFIQRKYANFFEQRKEAQKPQDLKECYEFLQVLVDYKLDEHPETGVGPEESKRNKELFLQNTEQIMQQAGGTQYTKKADTPAQQMAA